MFICKGFAIISANCKERETPMPNKKTSKKLTHLDVLNQIRNEQSHFSAAQRQVADYVLKYFHQVPFLSISALAENIGVSNNSIIKFCNHLGFAKFAEFKRIFSEHAHATLTAPTVSKNKEDDNSDNLFVQNLQDDMQAISDTMNNPSNQENLQKAVSMITKARQVIICGGSRSYPMAYTLCTNLQWLRIPAFSIYYEPDSFWVKVRTATPEDLVIMITMPEYSSSAVDCMRRLKDINVPILLLTDNGLSPALPYADLTLYCAYYDHFYLFSNIGMHSMINTLCRAINRQLDAEKYNKNKDTK